MTSLFLDHTAGKHQIKMRVQTRDKLYIRSLEKKVSLHHNEDWKRDQINAIAASQRKEKGPFGTLPAFGAIRAFCLNMP